MSDVHRIMPKRALISVSDKTGLQELGQALSDAGVTIISTGSTASTLRAAGIDAQDVSDVTGFPESLDGRVKTLHPAIHGGILADLRKDEHTRALEVLGITAIELVVVNLYPFVETVASGASGEDVIEQIDIGGPAMVRAAAKNHANVAIVVSPAKYPEIMEALAQGGTTLATRELLAREAFWHTANYDAAVAGWLSGGDLFSVHGAKETSLRYGENSHQAAALYSSTTGQRGLAQATVIQGKEMSYNNYLDADAALRAAYDHDAPTVAIIKHQNPCGIASAETLARAHYDANACDPVSAFGGVIAANRVVDQDTALSIGDIFTEVVIAPGFTDDALEVFRRKSNLRLVQLPQDFSPDPTEIRHISGGFLVQDADRDFAPASTWTLVSGSMPDDATMHSLEFAWRAVRAVKSNAILLAQGTASVGVGMGQVNRVDSCQLAVSRAGDRAIGSVAASDAFFPFADGLELLIQAGVTAVVQPGGSVRDQEVIDAAVAAGITMFFTGERHFFH
jgi:phosphoribosylaminoimidazolecarboxamide formyltransferase / IMP cyclohydrolase